MEEKKYILDKVAKPVQKIIKDSAIVFKILLFNVLIALIFANSMWHEWYHDLFHHTFGINVDGKTYLNYDLHHWINDGLMSIFFFVVGLELKREMLAGGSLHNPKQALLPIVAALGGMLMPALIYFGLNPSGLESNGWGIPMATDIAFALGVVYLLGDIIPLSWKVFLTTLAIVDDIGAVLVIAFFYTDHVSIINLGIAMIFIAIMFAGNKLGVRNVLFYGVIGIGGVWTAFLLSGVHATIASILAAFTIPSDVRIKENVFVLKIEKLLHKFKQEDPSNEHDMLLPEQVHTMKEIQEVTKHTIPLLQRLENSMHPLVMFFVLPLFAFANAGIAFHGIDVSELFNNNILIGVLLGLIIGKSTGVFLFTWLTSKILKIPLGMPTKGLFGLSYLAGIGFTMSLFITQLAFKDEVFIMQAKVGIVLASIFAGTIGYFLLHSLKQKTNEQSI